MFGWFKKKNSARRIVAPDSVYMFRRVADEALVKTAEESDLPVIITSFFPDSLSRIHAILNSNGINALNLDIWKLPTCEDFCKSTWLLPAIQIHEDRGFDNRLLQLNKECLFLFVEHYPLIDMEDYVLDVINKAAQSRMQRVIFFVGMDEPLMKIFNAQRIIDLMQTMGLQEHERISHPMVDKAILNARKKIQSRIAGPIPSNSDDEWFQKNLR